MALDKTQLITDLTTIFEDLDSSNTAAGKADEIATAIDDYLDSDYVSFPQIICNTNQVICHNNEIVWM